MEAGKYDIKMISSQCSLLLLLFLLAVLSQCQCEVSQSVGFSLKLVRRRFHEALETRANYLQNASTISNSKQNVFPNIIRPHITYSDYTVTIDASIGTPSERKTFIFDIASSLTWTQCFPCKNCFNQTLPLFDPKTSTSYAKMATSHPFSDWFNTSPNGSLVYIEKYLFKSNQTSQGIVSLETFSFPSNFKAKHIVFGCANNNLGNWPNNTPITGIMGMDRSPLSLISQIGVKSVRRFSYCLPKLSSPNKTTFLRFGTDVKTRSSNLLTTKLMSDTHKYMVNLQGISIAGRRLNLAKGTFPHGCLIDIATSRSRLEARAYTGVVKILTQRYFDSFKMKRLTGPIYEGQLCYRLRGELNSFPNMTFHFKRTRSSRGADFQIGSEKLFVRVGDIFCMAVDKQEKLTILGAFQMQNVRFIFDVVASKVSFGAEDCFKDKA